MFELFWELAVYAVLLIRSVVFEGTGKCTELAECQNMVAIMAL